MPTLSHDLSTLGLTFFFARMLSKLLLHLSLRRCRISVSVQYLCRTVKIAIPDPSSFTQISRFPAPTQLS